LIEPSWTEEERALLEARTRALSAPAAQPPSSATIEAIALRVGGERYAIAASEVRAVAALARLTPLPHAPPEVAGLTARGGAILPVFHLRAVLGLALSTLPEHGRIVLLGQGDDLLALVIDAVEGFHAIDVSALREAPPTVSPAARELIRGLDPAGVPLLDPAALLAHSRLFIDIAPPAPSIRQGA
jgi:purine-binding chemotaxis protein CheW